MTNIKVLKLVHYGRLLRKTTYHLWKKTNSRNIIDTPVPGLQVTVTVWYWLTLGDIGCQGAQEPRHVAEDLVQHDREGGEGQPLGPRLQRGGGAAVTCQVHVTLVIDVM